MSPEYGLIDERLGVSIQSTVPIAVERARSSCSPSQPGQSVRGDGADGDPVQRAGPAVGYRVPASGSGEIG